MEEELTQEEAEEMLLQIINYINENDKKEDASIWAKHILKQFDYQISNTLIKVSKEKISYKLFYLAYYLKTLGETYLYYDIFDEAFDSIDFEKYTLKLLKEEIKTIKEDKSYEKLVPFYETIKEILMLDKNRSDVVVREMNILSLMLDGHGFSCQFPVQTSNDEMKKRVSEKMKVLNPDKFTI